MDSKFGAHGWRPSPKFGRRQNGKVRCIEDGKCSLLNKAYQNTETVALMEPRFTAAWDSGFTRYASINQRRAKRFSEYPGGTRRAMRGRRNQPKVRRQELTAGKPGHI